MNNPDLYSIYIQTFGCRIESFIFHRLIINIWLRTCWKCMYHMCSNKHAYLNIVLPLILFETRTILIIGGCCCVCQTSWSIDFQTLIDFFLNLYMKNCMISQKRFRNKYSNQIGIINQLADQENISGDKGIFHTSLVT